MEEACEDIDQMFSNLLGEMDLLTQSLEVETGPPPSAKISNNEFNFAVGFKDLNESLNTLEDTDLDALMADLVADISEVEKKTTAQEQTAASYDQQAAPIQPSANAAYEPRSYIAVENDLPPPPVDLDLPLPSPLPPPATKPLTKEEQEAQAKADKIKLALEKMKEAKVKKLVVKVHMKDNSTKSLMVDERQTARNILDNLFEKTHCDCRVDWCLYEVYPELQIERFFEDHENVVEILSDWTRDSENKILFLYKDDKYALFKNPQNFYLASKDKNESKEMNEKSKEALLEESFCGTSVIVPELEGALYLKEDGKKSWKRRYFLLRASGIYYVPKGKTKTSRDLACFIQFENVNIYYGIQCKVKYKAPTDYCFVLKHPQIQKESQYIKYLCCDDKETLHKWVTGIRIAKYGKTLYDNYKCALQKASLASRWGMLGNAEHTSVAESSPKGRTHANGQIPQARAFTTEDASESGKRTETPKADKPDSISNSAPMAPPSTSQLKLHRKPGGLKPPPPPQRRSSAVPTSLIAKGTETASTAFTSDLAEFPPPPPPELMSPLPKLEDLPPPPPDFYEAPPDFVPPPPPSFNNGNPELPPPPLPASVSAPTLPPPARKKMVPPPPPKRQDTSRDQGGDRKQSEPVPSGEATGQGDLMSDLMRILQKKRAETS